MRGLWWKTWRETWLPFELAVLPSMGFALLLDRWVRTLPEQDYDLLTRSGPTMIAFAFCAVVGAMALLGAADSPRSLGLDGARPFLRSRPQSRRALAVPWTVLLGAHSLFAYVMCVVYVLITGEPNGHPPIPGFESLVEWPLLFWVFPWAAAFGSVIAGESRRVGPWVGVALAMLVALLPFRLALYPEHHLVQRVVLAVLLPGLCVVLALVNQATWMGRARRVLIAVLVVAVVVPVAKRQTRGMTPGDAVEAVARVSATDATFALLRERVHVQYERLEEQYGWRRTTRLWDEVLWLALEHPDRRVGDAFLLGRVHLAPSRALAVVERERGLTLGYPLKWPEDPSGDAAMFKLAEMKVRQAAERQGEAVRPGRRYSPTWELTSMLSNAPTPVRRDALLDFVASWPEWDMGRPLAFMLHDSGLAIALRGRLRAPEWMADKPWRTDDPDARNRVLLDIAPYDPPGMAAEAADLLAHAPELTHGSRWILESYLSDEELLTALITRWETLPGERGWTFDSARSRAPGLALAWLCEEPLDSALAKHLLRGKAIGWAPVVAFRGGVQHGRIRSLDERRTYLVADLIRRVPMKESVSIPPMLAAALVRGVEDAAAPYPHLVYARALERLTGYRYGYDARAWNRWLATQPTVAMEVAS